jgi:hypothetical protein
MAVHEDGKVGVGVDVNESRRNKPATNVKGLLSLERASRGNPNNPTLPDGEVTPEPGVPTSV